MPPCDVAPHAARAAGFAHHMVQQHVGAAGRTNRGERPDDRVGGQRGPQYVGLEPAFENRPGGTGEQFDRLGQIGRRVL